MNPQTLNRYSYVGNNPTNFVDPSGHVRLDPPSKGDQGGYLRDTPYADSIAWQDVNAITNAADEAAANASEPDSSASQGQTVSEPQTPTGMTVTVATEANTMVNVPFGGSLFTGVGGFLQLTPTDQNGNPIPNVTVIESVSPSSTIQASGPVTSRSGTVTDLVGSGERHPASQPKTLEQAAQIIVPRLNAPTTITQTHQLFIFSPTSGIIAIATHTRTLTNVDQNGNLVNNVVGNRIVNNYRISISPVTVIRRPMVMCPRF
jgi:hypothetical protein